MPGLDDFLNEEVIETGADEAAEAARLAAEQAEADRIAAESAEQAAAVQAAEEAKSAREKAFETAMIAERHKRQALEAQLLEKSKQAEEDDPYAAEIANKLREEFSQQLLTQKLNLSEAFARDKHTDFDDKLEVFKGLIAENPALYHQMTQQADPAGFMYKTASNQLKLKEMANPEEYENKLREKIRAELKAEQDKEAAKRDSLPGTLATTRGVAGTHTPEWSGPPPLSDILN